MTREPRALRHLAQMPLRERLRTLGQGVELLGEHVAVLGNEVQALIDRGESRAARILDVTASEEAAKALILIDIARTPHTDHESLKRLTRAFYSHLARGIYVLVHSGSSADFGEIRSYVDVLRQTHYLDGPTGADAIFRNMVDSLREEAIYVDLVADDDGALRWVSPAHDTMPVYMLHPVSSMVMTMRAIGLLNPAGMDVVAEVWRGAAFHNSTRHEEFVEKNLQVASRLISINGRPATDDDFALKQVIDHWVFPLGALDMTPQQVAEQDLRNVQRDYYSDLGDLA